ncbi:MAG: glycosyltransferase family 4 protein [bacterium]
MKKTLLFTLDFPPRNGGVAKYYENLCAYFSYDKIAVLCQNESGGKDFDRRQKYKIFRKNLITRFPIWPKWIFSFFYLWRVNKKEGADIILVGQVLPLGTVAWIYKKLFKIPYGVFIHGMDIAMTNRIARKNKLARKILKNAEFIVANSEYTKGLIKGQGISGDKIKVVYPCVSQITQNNTPYTTKRREKILLTIGRLVKRKGQDMVIKALPKVLEKFPEMRYIIAGDGFDRKYLENLSKKCGIEKNVKFLGEISDEQKFELYADCDIFIMPSRDIDGDVEGFGIVYLEAALYEKPAIAGKSGGTAEAVLDGQTGVLVNPESIDEIRDAIIKLLANPDLANKFGVQGRKRVLSEFTLERQAEKIRKLYEIITCV